MLPGGGGISQAWAGGYGRLNFEPEADITRAAVGLTAGFMLFNAEPGVVSETYDPGPGFMDRDRAGTELPGLGLFEYVGVYSRITRFSDGGNVNEAGLRMNIPSADQLPLGVLDALRLRALGAFSSTTCAALDPQSRRRATITRPAPRRDRRDPRTPFAIPRSRSAAHGGHDVRGVRRGGPSSRGAIGGPDRACCPAGARWSATRPAKVARCSGSSKV